MSSSSARRFGSFAALYGIAETRALIGKALRRHGEVQPVARVVAETEHHTRAPVGRAGDPEDLLGGRGGEQVAHRGAVGEANARQDASSAAVTS